MDVGEKKRKLILMKNLSYITSYVYRGKSTENLALYMLYSNIPYSAGTLKRHNALIMCRNRDNTTFEY